MKQIILAIVLATTLTGCYVGVRSPIYGGFEPPFVEQGPPVAQAPPGAYSPAPYPGQYPPAPYPSGAYVEPPFYPYVAFGPYGYWGGGWYGRHWFGRGFYGHRGRHR
jgi:hypothetical protein